MNVMNVKNKTAMDKVKVWSAKLIVSVVTLTLERLLELWRQE